MLCPTAPHLKQQELLDRSLPKHHLTSASLASGQREVAIGKNVEFKRFFWSVVWVDHQEQLEVVWL